jgi:hypothetical protein
MMIINKIIKKYNQLKESVGDKDIPKILIKIYNRLMKIYNKKG